MVSDKPKLLQTCLRNTFMEHQLYWCNLQRFPFQKIKKYIASMEMDSKRHNIPRSVEIVHAFIWKAIHEHDKICFETFFHIQDQ